MILTENETPVSWLRSSGKSAWTRNRILERLSLFVRDVCKDPVFRRRLRYHPPDALRQHSLPGILAPEQLRVRHHEIDILVNEGQVFGLSGEITAEGNIPLDLRLVMYGAKPACIIDGSEVEMNSLVSWAEKRSLIALYSPFEREFINDEGKGGYSNLASDCRRIHLGSSALRSLIISKDEDQAILVWLSLLFRWDLFLGPLLGYPDCCSKAFYQRWPDAVQRHQGDLAIPSLHASGPPPFDWRVNIFGRYFGFELLQHFPCQFECQASNRLGRIYAIVMRQFEPEEYTRTKNYLSAPIFYTEREGVALLPQAKVLINGKTLKIEYSPKCALVTKKGGDLEEVLWSSNSIVMDIYSPKIGAGEKQISGNLIWFNGEDHKYEGEIKKCSI